MVDGAAAAQRDEKKKEKYRKKLIPEGSTAIPIPLVIEHYGTWGVERQRFLQKLAKKAADEVGKPNEAEFVTTWKKDSQYNSKNVMRESC